MLDMAIAACRDPEPGEVGEALETIGSALSAAAILLQSADGVRAAIDLVYRAIVRAATELPDPRLSRCARRAARSVTAPARSQLAAQSPLSRRSRSRRPSRSAERADDLIDLVDQQTAREQMRRRARDRPRQIAAAVDAAGSRAPPACEPLHRRSSHGIGSRAGPDG